MGRSLLNSLMTRSSAAVKGAGATKLPLDEDGSANSVKPASPPSPFVVFGPAGTSHGMVVDPEVDETGTVDPDLHSRESVTGESASAAPARSELTTPITCSTRSPDCTDIPEALFVMHPVSEAEVTPEQ